MLQMNPLPPFLGKILVVVCSITLVNFHQAEDHRISENGSICSHHHENLISCKGKKIFMDPLDPLRGRHLVPSNSERKLT
jgi:hypothetical protein